MNLRRAISLPQNCATPAPHKGRKRRILLQLYKYFWVSAAAAFADFASFLLILKILDNSYILATTISFIIGLAVNYFLSVNFVFKQESHVSVPEFLFFGAIGLIGLGITYLVLFLCINEMGIPAWLSKVAAIGITFLWNFSARKALLFNKERLHI